MCACMSNSVIKQTVAHQAPLSIEFSRQEHWSELPFPTPGDLPNAGIEPASLVSLEWAGGVLTTAIPVKPPPTMGRDSKNLWKVLSRWKYGN